MNLMLKMAVVVVRTARVMSLRRSVRAECLGNRLPRKIRAAVLRGAADGALATGTKLCG